MLQYLKAFGFRESCARKKEKRPTRHDCFYRILGQVRLRIKNRSSAAPLFDVPYSIVTVSLLCVSSSCSIFADCANLDTVIFSADSSCTVIRRNAAIRSSIAATAFWGCSCLVYVIAADSFCSSEAPLFAVTTPLLAKPIIAFRRNAACIAILASRQPAVSSSLIVFEENSN